ncbi:MAG: hypothetical protein NC253_00775 [Ruminococcus sp.]|nr:hypothetical protein [Ruminococcus sp.]MCM1380975.1 hypothetical protein [Muribaculaceae bacterium]
MSAAKFGGDLMFEDLCKPFAEKLLGVISSMIGIFSNIYENILGIDVANAGIAMDSINAAAVALTSLFLCMEFFSQMTSKWFERIEDAIQLGIKLVVAKIIIENSSSIIGGIYSYFKKLGIVNISEGLNAISTNLSSISGVDGLSTINGGFMGIAYLFVCLALVLVLVVVFVILVMLAVEIMGIVFEIAIHQAVGPIALSTLCNSTFRSTGLSFIKSYSAVCLQTTVIGAIFKVYAAFFAGLDLSGFAVDGFLSLLFGYATPILGLIVICVTVKKSSDITKRLFGA